MEFLKELHGVDFSLECQILYDVKMLLLNPKFESLLSDDEFMD